MARRVLQTDLPELIREIEAFDRAGCLVRWEASFGGPPPKYLSIRFLQRVLIHDLQCRVLGWYSVPVRRVLKSAMPNGAGQGKASPAPSPGAHLVREWNGRTYRVEVTASGYVLDGQSYRSLSAVARRITGANWSGPRFFGLTERRAS
ncbi:DUF2924 domain-containing protein [Aliiruegeria lutimaris]|uniref:DUF2924 domain-containing protein n=1 Tax=Aliiruegeria lutimaris TaxID=571298 RepID=A0A1G9NBF3_9RHOB|nr:DUF2924 domain-containing protein [Aliiruegeria lutimaris]SDL83713.1 Protein of unknown function [Aliiruegeria lutimaris]